MRADPPATIPATACVAAIYVIRHRTETMAHVRLALAELLAMVPHLLIVTDRAALAQTASALRDLDPDRRMRFIGCDRDGSILSAYRAGLRALAGQAVPRGAVFLAGYHVFGPIRPGGWRGLPVDADLLAPYWHRAAGDPRLQHRPDMPARLPCLDMAILSAELRDDPAIIRVWDSLPPFTDSWDEVERGLVPLARALRDTGRRIAYALPDDALDTVDPRHAEVDRLVALGAPCLPVSILTLDPLLHDLNGIDLRAALDRLRGLNPDLYRAVIAFACARVPLRAFTTIADQYEVLSPHYPSDRATWGFGRVAVFIHAFYADMMPEFWDRIARFPMPAHLFISTASGDDQRAIAAFLDRQGWPRTHRTIRVVDQNRGRDMSALFITFRDVALSGDYRIGLRLHSKRTPQVSPQVARGFKAHLFDNLLPSPAAIRQILDRFEAEPDIGLMFPPVIHLGFGTLGHAWYANRPAAQDLRARLGLALPLDDHTPVAPYGTMFWFRIDALRPLFDHPWRWEDYNPEPDHVDGGLAHVQERLIGYVAQSRGFRVLQVMSPEQAARNYARLEYKMQLFAAHLASHHLLDQVAQLDRLADTWPQRLHRRLRACYGRIIRRCPAARSRLRPLARGISRLLAPGHGS
ncbi:MAG: rhamnan synthesis F family protein [Rhodobacterales bacterium]|nr:rhamnan synthesis F family protein [Rhodobacterales bacterium]MDX5391046.1 rhamnan synthesis F family protein [Rhodobacterales bacterium]MDX5490741.1 rhamnan synthesis F family protein [Rhodobacterales bacterium]